jgi:hypothetical protein
VYFGLGWACLLARVLAAGCPSPPSLACLLACCRSTFEDRFLSSFLPIKSARKTPGEFRRLGCVETLSEKKKDVTELRISGGALC